MMKIFQKIKNNWNRPVPKWMQILFDLVIISICSVIIKTVILDFYLPLFSESPTFESVDAFWEYHVSWEFITKGIGTILGFIAIVICFMFIYLFGCNYLYQLSKKPKKG